MFCFLSLLSGNYFWMWHWGRFAARKWQEGSSLRDPETRGECFPRYTFSITRFFPSVILHNTYLNNVLLRICVFSLSLPRLSQQHRVQASPSGRGSSLWRLPPSRRRRAPLQRAAAAAGRAGTCTLHASERSKCERCWFCSLQRSRVVYSGHRGQLSSR